MTLRMLGHDFSNWQGVIDWPKVDDNGAEFVILKASEGVDYADRFFIRNWKGAKENGLMRGAYHYCRPEHNSAEDEANWFLANVEEHCEPGDVLALDFEPTVKVKKGAEWCLDWLRHVESRLGFKPMLYTAPNWIQQYDMGKLPELGEYPLWLASWRQDTSVWPTAPYPWTRVSIWQVGSSGSNPGVAGLVDVNLFDTSVVWQSLGKPGVAPAGQETNEQRLINLVGYLSGNVANDLDNAINGLIAIRETLRRSK